MCAAASKLSTVIHSRQKILPTIMSGMVTRTTDVNMNKIIGLSRKMVIRNDVIQSLQEIECKRISIFSL